MGRYLCCDSALICSTGGAKFKMGKGKTIVLKMKIFYMGQIVKKAPLHHSEERAIEFLALEIFKTL